MPIPGDACEFVGDVGIPDGTVVRIGEQFVKTWRIRHTGSVVWANRYLRRVRGSETTGDCRTPSRVPIPVTEPGHTAQVAVPAEPLGPPGICEVYRTMVDETGRRFKPSARPVFFEVVVE